LPDKESAELEGLLGLPTCEELLDLIRKVRARHEAEVSKRSTGGAERAGGVVLYNEPPGEVIVVGDLHGDASTLRRILAKTMRSLEKATIVFLGDYVDRGTPEGQASVLAGILRLKLRAPERVVLLRGNHEPPPGLEPMPHDFPVALIRLCPSKAGEIYEEARKLFDTMPHAVLVRGWALLVHAGVPTTSLSSDDALEILAARVGDEPSEPLAEILWNDPDERVEWSRPSPRGVGYLWGPKATHEALRKLGVHYVIRGHEATRSGYKFNHNLNGSPRVITLFSRTGPPYGNLKAAFMHCQKPSPSNTLGCIRVLS